MDSKKLRKAQMIMFELLVELDKICQKHSLKYWLDSGTLLGAVRDKGFLKWDDDLDVTMTIEDYKKFCKIAKSELPSNIFLQNSDTDNYFPYDYSKIRSNKGTIIEKHELDKSVKYNQGIFIDILPCIAIKNNIFHKYAYWSIFLCIKVFSYGYLNVRSIRKLLISIGDNFHLGWDHNDTKAVRSCKFPSFYMNIDKSSIFPLRKITFENKEFWAPNNYDDYLKVYYGNNYMIPPPESEREIHAHNIEIHK